MFRSLSNIWAAKYPGPIPNSKTCTLGKDIFLTSAKIVSNNSSLGGDGLNLRAHGVIFSSVCPVPLCLIFI